MATLASAVSGLANVSALVVGASTLALGTLWAYLFRRIAAPKRAGLTAALAALNAGLTVAAIVATESPAAHALEIVLGFLTAATVGAFIWGPAALLAFYCLGKPMALAEGLASRGSSGRDRGERVVAVVCAFMPIAGFVISFAHPASSNHLHPGPAPYADAGTAFTRVLGILGAMIGAAAFAVASLRSRRRAAFIAAVQTGAVAQFRVETREE